MASAAVPVLRRRIEGRADLLALAAARPRRYPALLESAADGGGSRWDVLFAFPGEVIDAGAPGFLAALDAAWQAQAHARCDEDLPFRGGWLLYLGYELAAAIEPSLDLPLESLSYVGRFKRRSARRFSTTEGWSTDMSRNDSVGSAASRLEPTYEEPGSFEGQINRGETGLPTALALRCPAAILVDRRERCTWLIAEAGSEHCLAAMSDDLDTVAPSGADLPELLAIDEDEPQRYLDGIARIHDYLRSGDVFQVNLSRGWRARYAAPVAPASLYSALRRANPAPFAALLQWQGTAVLSSSPERLVSVRGDRVATRPIAGTRARFAGDDDAARRRELVGHPKERAEHVMLIDLERNDLGRIAVPGSVVVDELMTVESYAHVHHIVSNVSATKRAYVSPGAVIRAVFPGGTITGCPKVRCMQIIAELEGVPRGAYTGSIGYLNRDGDMDLNILIRTLTLRGTEVSFRAGAGIVVDSDPMRELEETRAKARGLLRALGVET